MVTILGVRCTPCQSYLSHLCVVVLLITGTLVCSRTPPGQPIPCVELEQTSVLFQRNRGIVLGCPAGVSVCPGNRCNSAIFVNVVFTINEMYRFGFTLISILFRAEVRAILCLSVLFNIFDRVILCCVAICFMFVLANKINNSFNPGDLYYLGY